MRRHRASSTILALVWCCACSVGEPEVQEERLTQSSEPVWKRRDEVHALYSGHSLTDDIPEAMTDIARSLGRKLEFEFQSIGYSSLRDRTRGTDLKSEAWTGYRTGKNRRGEGLHIASELERPTQLSPGARYDALVVTERHDLPKTAVQAQTATYLVDIAKHAWAGNPDADVFFYHVWMPIDVNDPLRWVQYERSQRKLWECVASRANLTSKGGNQRIRVLPGASALADLVGEMWRGSVPGLTQLTPVDRVKLLFRDDVHLSAIGTYFLALVHYAALYGQSPHGAAGVPGLDVDTVAHFQGVATRHVAAYGRIADAAATRSMAECRAFAAESCALLFSLKATSNPIVRAKQKAQALWWSRRYADARDPENPFHD